MTPVELEQIATKMRATGLHSSWNELIEFSNDVVGGLVEAYQTLLKDSTSSNGDNKEKICLLVRDRLSKALVSLTSPAHVARWESEVMNNNYIAPATIGKSTLDTE
jgi:hypothetical protein